MAKFKIGDAVIHDTYGFGHIVKDPNPHGRNLSRFLFFVKPNGAGSHYVNPDFLKYAHPNQVG